MKIVIIGQGIVGQATEMTLNQKVEWHDPPKGLFANYKDADVVFICPMDNAVENYIQELKNHNCTFIRSTILPNLVKNTNFAVYPEFLTERIWQQDAVNPENIILGANQNQIETLKKISKLSFDNAHFTTNEIAALTKVTTNAFFSTKVIFMNLMYQACNSYGINYEEFKECLKSDSRIGDMHLEVPGPDNLFGFGGKCFPKDTKLLHKFFLENNIDINLLDCVLKINDKIR
jgi:UDPglucose 6-dehydrogenase